MPVYHGNLPEIRIDLSGLRTETNDFWKKSSIDSVKMAKAFKPECLNLGA